ncbi:hypothetical protein GCM10027180_35920 [Microbulbifer echini]
MIRPSKSTKTARKKYSEKYRKDALVLTTLKKTADYFAKSLKCGTPSYKSTGKSSHQSGG